MSQFSFSKLDDPDLIAACLAGEEQAWVALIERYNRLIYTIPWRAGFSKAVVDEIFQETCVILLEGLENLHDRRRLALDTHSTRAESRGDQPPQRSHLFTWDLNGNHSLHAIVETLDPP